jgi:phosphoribosylglycinamide formyltransferase-1
MVPIGADLNTSAIKTWLAQLCEVETAPYFFIYIDQILAPWWIKLTEARVINSHPAVLPYARGMYALENLACTEKRDIFRCAAGATVHYIDSGIDTGPIIKAERFSDPFVYGSIWELKAHAVLLAFQLLVSAASAMLSGPQTSPVGIYPDPELRGPNFKSRDFTPAVRQRAEVGYLAMKKLC